MTAEQWSRFQQEFHRPDLAPCDGWTGNAQCNWAALLGQELFFDKSLSDLSVGSGGNKARIPGSVACVTCHDPKQAFIDTRTPNNVSLGATKPTKRNAMTVLDVGLKYQVAPGDKAAFGWIGKYHSPGEILDLAVTAAMSTTHDAVTDDIALRYPTEYQRAFGAGPPTFENLERAFDAYLMRLDAGPAPFDHFIAGEDGAISAAAERGFAIFVGNGGCVECHSGAAFTDFQFHVTGVAPLQDITDDGRMEVTKDPADIGAYMTAPLREVAKTGPYMHDGSLPDLTAVVDFYRKGGEAAGFAGRKDPRIQPLDISDDDAADLVAFLQTLTGPGIAPGLGSDTHPDLGRCASLTECGGMCVDVATNQLNCGQCGSACDPMHECSAGSCVLP